MGEFLEQWGPHIISSVIGVIGYVLHRTYAKRDDLSALDKRVQSLEQTYTPNHDHKRLDKRVTTLEATNSDIPQIVDALKDSQARLQEQVRHLERTLERVERPLNLIIETAMKSDK